MPFEREVRVGGDHGKFGRNIEPANGRREPRCRLGLTHPFGALQGEGWNGFEKNLKLLV